MVLVQHVRDEKELQVVTYYDYAPVGQISFTTPTEKKLFVNECANVSHFVCVSADTFNAMCVDVCRPITSYPDCVDVVRATNAPHPRLGPYVLVY